jgi:5'-nucleotidase/UDP-sugar diphosphatase
MKKLVAVAALSTSIFGLSAGQSFADYTLNILHFNDWHSRIESNNKYESTCSTEEEGKGECFGGAARLVTAVKHEREKLKDQNVVLLNAGDNFQGSLFYTTYKGKAEQEFLNQIGIDAMALGNHEFDDGEDALIPFIESAKFPILGVNIKPNNQSKANGKIRPSVVLEIGGQKVGVVGAVTTETPEIASPGPNIQIEDDVANITAEVKKLTDEGVDKIIALTHVGYPRDKELIAKIPGVDVVVGGHIRTRCCRTPTQRPRAPIRRWSTTPSGLQGPGDAGRPRTRNTSASSRSPVRRRRRGQGSQAGDPLFLDKSIVRRRGRSRAHQAELGAPIEELKKKEVGRRTACIDGSREASPAASRRMRDGQPDRPTRCSTAYQGSGRHHRHPERRRHPRLDRPGRRHHGRSAHGAAVPEHARHLPDRRARTSFRLPGSRSSAEIEEGKGKFPQVAGTEIHARQVGQSRTEAHASSRRRGQWMATPGSRSIQPRSTTSRPTTSCAPAATATSSSRRTRRMPTISARPRAGTVADYLAANRPYTPEDRRPHHRGRPQLRLPKPAKPAEAAARRTAPRLPAAPADAGETRRGRTGSRGTGQARPSPVKLPPLPDRLRRHRRPGTEAWKPRPKPPRRPPSRAKPAEAAPATHVVVRR